MGIKPNRKKLIDHKNRNPLHNHKSNFRFCTHKENLRNCGKHKDNTSGFKGVTWNKANRRWTAQIGVDGKNIHLGDFKRKIKAAIAYNIGATKYHKEFAYLNEV